MSSRIVFRVYGTPAPQGSKRGFVNKSGGVSMVESSAKVKPWRQDVKYAALEAHEAYGGTGTHFDRPTPVTAVLTYYLPRPKGHYRTGKNAHLLRPSAPEYPTTKPDIDKLVRSTLDALGEANIWADDSQVVCLHVNKNYASAAEPAGARIEVSP